MYTFHKMFKLFDDFTDAGFVLFHSEWNIFSVWSWAWEFSFIALDYAPVAGAPTIIERILKEPYGFDELNKVDYYFSLSLLSQTFSTFLSLLSSTSIY
jgi:hypothetical protein